MNAETLLVAAKTTLMFDNPFFGMLCVQLPLVEDPSCETMATDGQKLYFNSKFVQSLTKAELVFVVAHEVLHNAFEHHVRRQHRDPRLWNIAADYAINGELVECGFTMPKCGLIHKDFTGLSAEEIYRILGDDSKRPADLPDPGAIPGSSDPGGCGRIMDAADAHDKDGLERARAEARMMVAQAAAVAAKKAGKLSANLQRLINTLLTPVVDWRAVLRRFIDESNSRDYSWTRPNRRYLSSGFILPGMVTDGISHITIAVDTSGSIDNDILSRFASEINGAFGDGMIDKITVIYADSNVCAVERFEAGDELKLNPAGGGGTAFSDTFDWIAKNEPDTNAIIYFTDLYVSDFGQDLGIPTLWAVYGDSREFERLSAKVPFGECVSVSE